MYKHQLHKTLGISIISWVIISLLVLERYPYKIDGHVKLLTMVIVSIIVIFNIIQIKSSIQPIRKGVGSSMLQRLMLKLLKVVYYEPLQSIGMALLKKANICRILSSMSLIYLGLMTNQLLVIMYTIYTLIVPRLILGIILFVDVRYINKICYFYKYIWILITPLIYLAVNWLLQQYVTECKASLEEKYFHVKLDNLNKEVAVLTPKHNLDPRVLQECIQQWRNYYNILDILIAINLVQTRWFFLLLRIVSSSLYIHAWTLYLYKVYLAKMSLIGLLIFKKYILSCLLNLPSI